MNFEQGVDPRPICAREAIETQVLPPPGEWNLTAQFIEALSTLAFVIVALPVYLTMSLALALAVYIRCAGVLLSRK